MEQKTSIRKNFMMNVLLTMSSVIFPLITFPYVSRVLLPAGTGRVTFATSLISYFNIFAQLGIPTYGIRAAARVREDKEELTRVSHELLIINLCTSLISYLALAVALLTVDRLQDDRTLYVIVSSTILLNAIGMEWLYKGLEQYTYITIRSVLFKFVALGAMFLLIHQQSDYVIYGGISIFAASASNVLNFINAHKYIHMKPVGNYRPLRHMKAVLVFFAMACATTIYTNLDNLMLGFMTTDADVGYYHAAVRVKEVLVSVVTSLGAVLLPRASYYIEHGQHEEFERISRKAFAFVLFIAIPLAVYFILFADRAIYLLSGKEYAGSILPMRIIMPTLILIGTTNIFGIQMLIPLGQEKYVLLSEICGAFTDLVLNWILIPKYQAAGAAIGTLAAEAVVLIVQTYAIRKYSEMELDQRHLIQVVTAVLCGTAASFWVHMTVAGNFLSLAVSASLFFLVFFFVLILMKNPTAEDILKQITAKLRRRGSE